MVTAYFNGSSALSQNHPPSLDTRVFDDVLLQGGADARKELARQLGDLLRDVGTPATERDAVIPSLLKLSSDPVFEVRQALAQYLATVPALHADVVFSIVADEDEVSLPFVASAVSIDGGRMAAILKVGDVSRQSQIATRVDVTPECKGMILKSCDWPVCAALLDNETFEPRDGEYRMLYTRFSDVSEITDRLIDRSDLPLEIRILHAKRTSGKMHRYLSQSGVPIATPPSEVVADAEETAILTVLACASEEELDRAIPFLLNKNLLTASIVLRAAAVGEMRIVTRAIAQLSRVPHRRIEALLFGRGSMGVRSALGRTGLSAPTTQLIRAAIDVERSVRQSGEDVSSDVFGVRVVELIIAHYEALTAVEKNKLLSFMVRYGTVRASAVASRLRSNLSRAA